MTEYDYSPDAEKLYRSKMQGVEKWVRGQGDYAPKYQDPFNPQAASSPSRRVRHDSNAPAPARRREPSRSPTTPAGTEHRREDRRPPRSRTLEPSFSSGYGQRSTSQPPGARQQPSVPTVVWDLPRGARWVEVHGSSSLRNPGGMREVIVPLQSRPFRVPTPGPNEIVKVPLDRNVIVEVSSIPRPRHHHHREPISASRERGPPEKSATWFTKFKDKLTTIEWDTPPHTKRDRRRGCSTSR